MRYCLVFVSFLIVAFGQPAWISGFGILAAAFGYALFWTGMLQFEKRRFLIAWGWYAAVQGVQFSWIATPEYMGPFIVPFYFFLILAMGLQFAILSSAINKNLSWHRSLCLAGLWVIFEAARLYFLCGCTWNPAGLALASSSYSIQFASIWGIFGLSFWVVWVNLILLKRKYAVWASLALFPYLFGLVQQFWIEKTVPVQKTIKVALVQTNWAPEEKDFDPKSPTAFVHPLDQWEKILNAINEPADIIILPEAVVPLGAHTASFNLSSIKTFFHESALPPLRRPYAIFHDGSWKVSNAFIVQALANQMRAQIIVGLDDREFDRKYNAAFLFSPGNGGAKRYEKQILAPIGEYIPLAGSKWFANFIGEQFGIYSSFDPGREGKIFQSHVPIGISICLEETFSNLIRQLRVKGAELFVSVSNDAYFPNTKLARQHFDHGRVRAAENGVVLLRSCNLGITGGIDCFGNPFKVLVNQKPKETGVLSFEMPIRSYKTLYTFWGDGAILALSALFIVTFLLIPEKKKLP